MNAQDKAEARAAIERAGEFTATLKTVPFLMRSETLHWGVENLLPELAAHLKAALDALEASQEEAARVRREALEWACAEMCQWCGIGIEVKQLEEEIMIYNRLYGPKGSWVHLDGETGKFLECHVSPIRQLITTGQKNVE